MSENILLSQALWLLSFPEAAGRVHGQHVRGRISISETSQRSPKTSVAYTTPGMLMGRLLTEAIVFARNAITRFANSDYPYTATPNPLAFSDSLMQSQQDILPAVSAFQRALKAATEVTEIPDNYDTDPSDFVDTTDEVAARTGIAACHILLSIGYSDPRDAASSASDALRGLCGALRAAAAVFAKGNSSLGAPILQQLGLNSAPCQVCLLAILAHGLDRLQRISASQIAVCRREAVNVRKLLEEVTNLASGLGGGFDGEGGGGDGGGGRRGLLVQISDREDSSRRTPSTGISAASTATYSQDDGRGQFLQALREVASELQRCLTSHGTGDAAATALLASLRAAHRRTNEELQRVGLSPPPGSEGNDDGGATAAAGAAATATAATGHRFRGLSSGLLVPLRGESRRTSYSSVSSGGCDPVAVPGPGGNSNSEMTRVSIVGGGARGGDGVGGDRGGDGGGGGGLPLVRSGALSRIKGGFIDGDDGAAVSAAVEAMAAADSAKATAQWVRQLPSGRLDWGRTSLSLTSSLSLSAVPISDAAASSQPSAGPRVVTVPMAADRLLLQQHSQQMQMQPQLQPHSQQQLQQQQRKQQEQEQCAEQVQVEPTLFSAPSFSISLNGSKSLSQSISIAIPLEDVRIHNTTGATSAASTLAQPTRVAYPPSLRPADSSPNGLALSTRATNGVATGAEDDGAVTTISSDQVRRSQLHIAQEPELRTSNSAAAVDAEAADEAHHLHQPPQSQQPQQSLQRLLQQQRERLSQLDPSFAISLPRSPSLAGPSAPSASTNNNNQQQQQQQHKYEQMVDETPDSFSIAKTSSSVSKNARGRSHTVPSGEGRAMLAFGAHDRGGDHAVPTSAVGVHSNAGGGVFTGGSAFANTGNAIGAFDDFISARSRTMSLAVRSTSGANNAAANACQGTIIGARQRLARSPSWQEAAASAVASAAAAAAAGAWKPAIGVGALSSVSSLGPRLSTVPGATTLATRGSSTGQGLGLLSGLGTGSGQGIGSRMSILAGITTAASLGRTSSASGPGLGMGGINTKQSAGL